MKHIRTAYGIIMASVITPLLAFAQGFGGQGFSFPRYDQTGSGFSGGFGGGGSYYGQTRGLQLTSIPSLLALINTLLGYMQVGIFLVALYYLLKGAYEAVTGGFGAAQGTLLNAVIGIGVAILAFSVIPFICFITQSNGPACYL